MEVTRASYRGDNCNLLLQAIANAGSEELTRQIAVGSCWSSSSPKGPVAGEISEKLWRFNLIGYVRAIVTLAGLG